MEWVIGLGLALLVVYTFLPDVFLHRLGIGSWQRQYGPGVCLTFDDGPDPDFTPQVLDILARHNCRGVFFLVGEKAAQNPGLVERIIREGHEIGAHSLRHRYAWFTSPWATWGEWDRCIALLEKLSGKPVDKVRPPWGTFNLVTWVWCLSRRKRAVLWSVEGHDWQSRRTPQEIARKIVGRVREGSIVVLHDSGGEPGAVNNTVKALNLICRQIVEDKKLPLEPLEFPKWSRARRIVFSLWEVWERIYARFSPSEKISSHNLFKLAKIRYTGPILYHESGEILAQSGDLVAEIHLESIRLTDNTREAPKVGLPDLQRFRESLTELARFVADNPEFAEIKVLVGETFINRGVKAFGFQVTELPPTLFNRWVGLIQKGIMRVYHPQGRKRRLNRLGNNPKLVWMSRQSLLAKWLPKDIVSD